MAKDIDLTSEKWVALIFEKKNKEYGAYVMRQDSSNRHLKALIIITVIGLAAIYLPNLIKSVIPAPPEVDHTQIMELSEINMEQKLEEENIIKAVEAAPPPPLMKETIKFTELEVVKDDEIKDEDLMLSQQDLAESTTAISVATVEGVKEGGIDIADIEGNKVVIAAEEAPEIFSYVEVMPKFIGGETEMVKWINKNLKIPTIAVEQGVSGTVNLRFVVKKDGSIDNVTVLKSLDPSCDKEAIRVIKEMPKWIPGQQNGNPVDVYFQLPIRFKVVN
jgi:protein TonB